MSGMTARTSERRHVLVVAIARCQQAKILPVRAQFNLWICHKLQQQQIFPAGKCDSYTRILEMNPLDDWLKTG